MVASLTTDLGVPGSRPGQVSVRYGLEQVTFTPFLVLVKPRKPWTYDCLRQTVTRLHGDYVVPNVSMNLVSRPDNMDETVLQVRFKNNIPLECRTIP